MEDIEIPARSAPEWAASLADYRRRVADGHAGFLPFYLLPALAVGAGWLTWSVISGSWTPIRLIQGLVVLACTQVSLFRATQRPDERRNVDRSWLRRWQSPLAGARVLARRYIRPMAVLTALAALSGACYAVGTHRLPSTAGLAGIGCLFLAPTISKARGWIRNRRVADPASLEIGALGLTMELGIFPVAGVLNVVRITLMLCLVASAICFWSFKAMADIGCGLE